MAALTLTAERRSELAALLGDADRLHASYPVVADYLDTTPTMAGTGDEQADAAFDLRLLHFMTGGESVSINPYWEIVAPSVSERDGRRVVDGGASNGSTRLAFAQTVLQAAYAYAIPSPETIEWAAGFCAGRRVVELGAGRGYWAAQLSRGGLDVDAYDVDPPDAGENVSFPRTGGQPPVWHRVGAMGDLAGFGDAVLLLCWPPGWGNTMASAALASFEEAGGRQLVFIGEPQGGKTGDDAFFDGLTARWSLESVDERFVSWWNLDDVAQGWVRR